MPKERHCFDQLPIDSRGVPAEVEGPFPGTTTGARAACRAPRKLELELLEGS